MSPFIKDVAIAGRRRPFRQLKHLCIQLVPAVILSAFSMTTPVKASENQQLASIPALTSPIPAGLVCHQAAVAAEGLAQLPQYILHAIALTESGRQNPAVSAASAWPWTVNAAGKSHYFETKQQAVSHVRGLLRRGITSIDVGCMQVNLQYHATAFKTLQEAFDPVTNMAYATSFLIDLKGRLGSWHNAIRHYYSANAVHHVRYHSKVVKHWNGLKRNGLPEATGEGIPASASGTSIASTSSNRPNGSAGTAWHSNGYKAQLRAEATARAIAMSPAR